MKNKILINLGTDHALECTEKVIGRAGEGSVTQLTIPIPIALIDYDVYVDFEKPNDETLRSPKLEVVNSVAYYDVPQYLLYESGELKVQLVFIKGKVTWKSSKKRFTILKSINAILDVPEKEDFFTEAQELIGKLSQEVEEVAGVLANDAKFAQSVIEACGGQTQVTTINGTTLKFFVGTQALYDTLSEGQRQDLFAIITDDRTKEELLSTLAEHQIIIDECDKLLGNKPYCLNGLSEGDGNRINKAFDLNDLKYSEHSGVYVLHYEAMARGDIKNLPTLPCATYEINGAKLIVEADYAEIAGSTVYQTLKVSTSTSAGGLLMYVRTFNAGWGEWKQLCYADEVKSSYSNKPIINSTKKTVDFPIGSLLTLYDGGEYHIDRRIGVGEVVTPKSNDYTLAVILHFGTEKIKSDRVYVVLNSSLNSDYSDPFVKLNGEWVLCGIAGYGNSLIEGATSQYYIIRRTA